MNVQPTTQLFQVGQKIQCSGYHLRVTSVKKSEPTQNTTEYSPNTYYKYAPNVFLAKCPQKYKKGEVIAVETKYGKKNNSIVFNLIAEKNGFYYYSIVRADGFNVQEWAKKKAEKWGNSATNAEKKSTNYWQAAQEGKDFLVLAEPIKIGHHSEKRHRALINRNWNRMAKCVEYGKVAETYESKAEYWKQKTGIINESMPESLEYFEFKLEEAKKRHQDLLTGKIDRSHSYSLTYAKKEANEIQKKLDLVRKLWA